MARIKRLDTILVLKVKSTYYRNGISHCHILSAKFNRDI